MCQIPVRSHTLSLKLSEVLSDIGVNEKIVLKRRRMWLLKETMWTFYFKSRHHTSSSFFHFGSQSEGSTTVGLDSDEDILCCKNSYNVIQDWSAWKHGKYNLLMIQDDTTSPGYCLLQWLRRDVPLPVRIQKDCMHFVTDRRGRLLLKNTCYDDKIPPGVTKNGPSHCSKEYGFKDKDKVHAFPCESWPAEAQPWLKRQGIGGWPTDEIKKYCMNTGCFVVPVSSKSGQNTATEWRISTSHAERCLMFSLNMTQLRCYILMKMILKTFINPHCNGVISSFMCKTVLFHCIQHTHSYRWQDGNLLPCLTCCIVVLKNFIRQENCPHFIIPENNLMAGRISAPDKVRLLEVLQSLIESQGLALLMIPIDDLGRRLQVKINVIPLYQNVQNDFSPDTTSCYVSAELLCHALKSLRFMNKIFLRNKILSTDRVRFLLSDTIVTFVATYCTGSSNMLEKAAVRLLVPSLCSSLGSVIASSDIRTNNTISPNALAWLSAGLNSDISSGRLKLASAVYCTGDMESAEVILENTEDRYDVNIVRPICGCYDYRSSEPCRGFMEKCNTGNEELVQRITAFCVLFIRHETNCVPQELQYEMYRTTEDDKVYRLDWMDWAVVDSLPYLYFLQYKTYSHLQRAEDQQRALTNLAKTIDTEPNLGHRETALNLLGQCMEQEDRYNDALRCYVRSLNIHARNNAAKIHICKLLNVLVKRYINREELNLRH